MTSILEIANYVQQQGDRGRERGLASLVGKAYQAQGPERQAILGAVAERGAPGMAYDANKHFGEMDDDARGRLGQYAMAFDALPDEQKAQAYPQLAQQAQALGIPAPMEWNPAFAPNIQKLAQALGGGGTGNTVQSRFVDQQGNVMALMRDGSVQSLGVQAENRLQMRDQPGVPLGAFDPRNGTIRGVPEGGGQQAPQGVQMESMPYVIDDPQNMPQQVVASIGQQEQAAGSRPWTQNTPNPYGNAMPTGAGAARPAISPAEQARLALSLQANQRAEEANQRAAQAAAMSARGNAPAGFRFKEDGSLEAIPGGPKPAGAAASEDERKAAAWLAQAGNAYENMKSALSEDPEADDPGLIETYSPIEELGNRSRSDVRQKYVQAASSIGEALLRAATGAGINEHEAAQKVKELTPQRGDSPAVKAQKMAAIPVYLNALKARAGRAVPQGQPAQASGPKRMKFNPATGRIE